MTLFGKLVLPVALSTGLYGVTDEPTPMEHMITVPMSQVQQLLEDNAKMRDLLKRATGTLRECSATIKYLDEELERKKREVCT